jgi:hypothetical protein
LVRHALAALTALSLAFAPKACVKKEAPPPEPEAVVPPLPQTTATAPPIWAPPEVPATGAVSSGSVTPAAPTVSPELLKARTAADAKDFKKVKTLLEKKVRGGKGTPEENQLLFRACVQTKDKACADAVKAKHPDDVGDGTGGP